MRHAAVAVSCRCLIILVASATALTACDTLSNRSPAAHEVDTPAAQDGGRNQPAGNGVPELSLPTTRDGRLDLSGGAWRMIDVPAAGNAPSIVRVPDGWLALSSRTFGSGKVITGSESVLYRSIDGASAWDRIALDGGDNLQLRSLAYGNGRYVMVGRNSGEGVVWASDDGAHWTESSQELDSSNQWAHVAFAGGRFIAFGFRVVGVSDDGESWQKTTVDLVQMMGLAHGNDRFVMTGSGPVITSEDGLHWQSRPIDCGLPDTCIVDPSGVSHPAILASVLFAEGRFFAGRLASPDAITWSVVSELAPNAYADGHFLSLAGYTLTTWTAGGSPEAIPTVRPTEAAVTATGREITSVGVLDRDAPLPGQVSTAFDDNLTCDNSRCLLVDGRLFLVPPPGTAPLPDRVPRTATGEPLLSDECPVSRMIFCRDYEARTDCICQPQAPRAPSGCDDVSQFICEGAFNPRAGEWLVDDVAEGGCSCEGSDPNQPPTFGLPCDDGTRGEPGAEQAVVCKAPLTCLPVRSPFSGGGFPSPDPLICTARCAADADCPSWQATGFCAGEVTLTCANGSCQPRTCD